MDNQNKESNQELELTIAHLAQHMQALREAVPVNYELKAKLKKRLMEQLKNKQPPQSRKQENTDRKPLWLMFSFLTILGLAILAAIFTDSKISISEVQDLGIFSIRDLSSNQPITVSPDGEIMVREHQEALYIFFTHGGKRTILVGEGEGRYHSPIWSNSNDWFAVVYEEGIRSEIRLIQPNKQFSSRIIYRAEDASLTRLSWSLDDRWLRAVEKKASGIEEAVASQTDMLQISSDGREVLRDVIIGEESTLYEQSEYEQSEQSPLSLLRWPKSLQEEIETADEIWFDWKENQHAFGLALRHNEEVQFFLIKLKKYRLITPGKEEEEVKLHEQSQ